MIRTYERTMMIEDLSKATVRIYLYKGCKYYEGCKYIAKSAEDLGEEKEITYTGLKNWSIVDSEDATEIENHTDGSCIDEYHEYLVLRFVDGSEVTFRNSHVDMFIR